MSYLQAQEEAKERYERALAKAREEWVASSNTYKSSLQYEALREAAEVAYNEELAEARRRHLDV